MKGNPDKIMATLHTYTSPAGKQFPVVLLDKGPNGEAYCLALGQMPIQLNQKQLTLGVVVR